MNRAGTRARIGARPRGRRAKRAISRAAVHDGFARRIAPGLGSMRRSRSTSSRWRGSGASSSPWDAPTTCSLVWRRPEQWRRIESWPSTGAASKDCSRPRCSGGWSPSIRGCSRASNLLGRNFHRGHPGARPRRRKDARGAGAALPRQGRQDLRRLVLGRPDRHRERRRRGLRQQEAQARARASLRRHDPRPAREARRRAGVRPRCSAEDSRPRAWKAKFFHNYAGSDSDQGELAVDVALRTSAAPTYFPSYQGFIDGGVVANNPARLRRRRVRPGHVRARLQEHQHPQDPRHDEQRGASREAQPTQSSRSGAAPVARAARRTRSSSPRAPPEARHRLPGETTAGNAGRSRECPPGRQKTAAHVASPSSAHCIAFSASTWRPSSRARTACPPSCAASCSAS